MTSPLDMILSKLDGVTRNGDGWLARCPAHDDRRPSLSLKTGDDGRVLVHCFAGCDLDAICAALGVTTRDLFERQSRGKPLAPWLIRDRTGRVIAEHYRQELPPAPKTGEPRKRMWWRLPGATVNGLDGLKVTDLPLYGSERLAEVPAGSRVIVAEGEKARDALDRRGQLAVGTVTGASTIPSDDVLRSLTGFTVVLWSDADEVGRSHMRRIGERLTALGIRNATVDPWPDRDDGSDAADFDGTDEELRALLDGASGTADNGDAASAPGVLLADVVPEDVQWLWYPRLPRGKLALITGAPDEGKTALALDIAARVSSGRPMPLETTPQAPGGVVVLSAEDGLADTIVPRLTAARADLQRIVSEKIEDLPSFDTAGLEHVRRLIARVNAVLVVVDPLAAFVPDMIDMHRDHHSRRLLRKLAGLAEEMGATVLVIRHARKGGAANPKDIGGGSVAFTAAARVELLAGSDPTDPSRKVLARVKGNLSAPFPSLAYRLTYSDSTVRVEWCGETPCTAADLSQMPREEKADKVTVAMEVLRELLAPKPLAADEAKKQLRAAGVSKWAWELALPRLGIRPRKEGFSGSWVWALPKHPGTHATRTFRARAGDTHRHSSSSSDGCAEDSEGPGGPAEDSEDHGPSGTSNFDGAASTVEDVLAVFSGAEVVADRQPALWPPRGGWIPEP